MASLNFKPFFYYPHKNPQNPNQKKYQNVIKATENIIQLFIKYLLGKNATS